MASAIQCGLGYRYESCRISLKLGCSGTGAIENALFQCSFASMNRVFGLDQHIVGCHIPMFPVLVANDSGSKIKLTRKEKTEQSVDTTRNPHG